VELAEFVSVVAVVVVVVVVVVFVAVVAVRAPGRAFFSVMSIRLVVVASGLILSACGGPKAPETEPMPMMGGRRVILNDANAIARARSDSARLPYVKADIDFMSGMIPHHAQAIAMAQMAPSRNASPAIMRLTGRIINAQQDEIVLMQQWLADRRQPVPPADPRGMKMVMSGHEMMHLMPGMLSQAQMDSLDRARGPVFDRLFLVYMIQHHRGAVSMVDVLFGTPGAGQDETVFRFASDVHTDQTTEIARMERMLDEFNRGSTP
jgi:uncharacterized protein (DUF305 family)